MTRVKSSSMTRNSSPSSSAKSNLPFNLAAVAVAASLLLVAAAFWTTPPVSELTDTAISSNSVAAAGTIQSGTAGGIPYYHCVAADSAKSSSTAIDLVLLHGSRFTKEDWKTSGILEKFCGRERMRVTALDLSVTAKHDELVTVMDALRAEDLLALPVAGLVTPSASGSTVLDGIASGHVAALKRYIRRWIPVAALAALHYSVDDLKVAVEDWPILAIYGDRDSAGKRSSDLLKQSSPQNTVVVELRGSHPCYLDSPDDFVETVMQHVS